MNKTLIIALFASFFISAGPSGNVQDMSRTKVYMKAMMMYQFATKITWPYEYKSGSFVIGVYGNSDLYDEISKSHGSKPVGSQPIKVIKYETAKEIQRCHILYVDKSKSASVTNLAKKFDSKSTLIVSNYTGGLRDGAVINFVVQNNRDKFELSKPNAQDNKLVLSSYIQGFAVNL